MSRVTSVRSAAVVLCSFVAGAFVAPAAPVPQHLIPKTIPLNHPTAVGSQWVYTTHNGEITWVLTKCEEKEKGDATHLTFKCTGPGERGPTERTMLLDHTGWYWVNVEGQKRDPPQCIVKLPHSAGEEWSTEFSSDGSSVTGRMKAVTVTQITPPGPTGVEVKAVFSFAHRGPDYSEEVTCRYENRVGLVKMWAPTGTWTLKSFTPGKK